MSNTPEKEELINNEKKAEDEVDISMQARIVIRNAETGEVILNTRG